MSEIFKLENINYCYFKCRPAIQNISITIQEGELLSIIGANGSGKSTLLHLICGLVFPTSGRILFKDNEINEKALNLPEFNAWYRSSIGYIFQNSDAQLFCPTVLDELIFGPLQIGLSKDIAMERALAIAQMLNITELFDRPTYMLSGGEKKRVAIGAVLTTNPEILIFDEPMSGLDPKTRAFIIELIFKLNEAGKTIIIATHHLEVVNHFQSRVMVLTEDHTIGKIGACDDILGDKELLIKANLIGEYPHKHGGTIHKHLSSDFLFFKHKH